MKVLLSIKPEYAKKILSGEKKFEFRKIAFLNEKIETVVIYATKPVGLVVGEFNILKIHKDVPKKIWEITKNHAGIDKPYFDSYYDGRKVAVAIAVGEVTSYKVPLKLDELRPGLTPPQSFCYLPNQMQSEFDLVS